MNEAFIPLINNSSAHNNDILCTVVELIAMQISNVFLKHHLSSALLTGGGAFNNYLVSKISNFSNTKIIVPENNLVNFKEAIIFGFLGVLRIYNEINCLSSATGSRKNHSSGDIYIS